MAAPLRWGNDEAMSASGTGPREGGVKVVLDVAEADVEAATHLIADAGFDVRRYYSPDSEHVVGGSSPGWIRLGAEQPMREFTPAEQDHIVAIFDHVGASSGLLCARRGTDSWTAADGPGWSGVREPRRPIPHTGDEASTLSTPISVSVSPLRYE